MEEDYRVIPGYEGYAVTKTGIIKSIERDLILKQYLLNGYFIVDTFRGSMTETLPVHRAVALAWVKNENPEEFEIVNHRDGNPLNNDASNLEWTDCSGNNYHAVNNGLRNDNIPCKLRDFHTGRIYEFSSLAQAAEFMGLRKDTSYFQLQPKMFGRLILGRYEFRFKKDPTPWFYENRKERVSPSRYMVTVIESDGSSKEIYSNLELMKAYQLYGSPKGKSIPALVEYANQIYPDKKFYFRDSYAESQFRVRRETNPSRVMPIVAKRSSDQLLFSSLSKCAQHFDVDRSSIQNRLINGRNLDGWTFTQLPS